MIDTKTDSIGLAHKFECSVHVAKRPGRIRAAAGDCVGLAALGRTPLRGFGPLCVHVDAAGTAFHRGAVEMVEENVAVNVVIGVIRPGPVLKQNVTVDAKAGREGRRLARVVRLRGALGQNDVGALCNSLRHQELELAGFVAARRKAGAIVSFDPDFRSSKCR